VKQFVSLMRCHPVSVRVEMRPVRRRTIIPGTDRAEIACSAHSPEHPLYRNLYGYIIVLTDHLGMSPENSIRADIFVVFRETFLNKVFLHVQNQIILK